MIVPLCSQNRPADREPLDRKREEIRVSSVIAVRYLACCCPWSYSLRSTVSHSATITHSIVHLYEFLLSDQIRKRHLSISYLYMPYTLGST